MFFKSKKPEPIQQDSATSKDLAIITQMNQEFATSLDLGETLQTALEVIIKRINAQAANIFLIDDKNQSFQCIASKHQAYLEDFDGWYSSSDAGYIDKDGYIWVMARTDDIINCAGHRLSTGAMEEVLSKHKDIAECAVVGIEDELKGQIPMGFIVINSGVKTPHQDIIGETISMVRNEIGPVASFRKVVVVKRLPKTRSGKILRSTMASIVDGKNYKMPATIDDPDILDEIKKAL